MVGVTMLLIIGAGLGGISEIAKNKVLGYGSLSDSELYCLVVGN